jgi:hypothetical protein
MKNEKDTLNVLVAILPEAPYYPKERFKRTIGFVLNK